VRRPGRCRPRRAAVPRTVASSTAISTLSIAPRTRPDAQLRVVAGDPYRPDGPGDQRGRRTVVAATTCSSAASSW
jgi:hypothetical protein